MGFFFQKTLEIKENFHRMGGLTHKPVPPGKALTKFHP